MNPRKQVKTKNPPVSGNKSTKPITSEKQPKTLILMVLLFCYGFFLYSQTVNFEFAMDDNIMIKLNKSVQKGTAGFGELFTKSMVYGSNGKNAGAYRPVTMISFALDKQLFGNNPAPFHFVNVFLYAITGIFLFLLLQAFFKEWNPVYPFIITLLFLAHPIHTEVVANIKSRDEILSFLFTVLAMLALFRSNNKTGFRNLFVSFILFLLGCLSKETALTFVLILPISLFFFTKDTTKDIFIKSLPFFGGALVYMILRTSFLDSMGSLTKIGILDNTLMAATTVAQKYATIVFITWKYLWLLVFPNKLSWDYSYPQIPISNFSEVHTVLPLILFLGLAAFAIFSFRKKNVFTWCILFFFLTLALVSNIFMPIAATMAERFLYFPSLAFCMAFVYGLIKIMKINPGTFLPAKQYVFGIVSLAIFLVYSAKTFSHAQVWKNNLALFESGVISAPNSSRTHSSLAYEYAVQAEQSKNPQAQHDYYSKSIESFKTALQLYDGNKEGWYNIAHTYDIMSDFDNAEKYYKKAIEIDPKAANSYNNLGAIYLRQSKYEQATVLFKKAVQLDKNYADPLGNLGAAFHFQGNYAEAIRYYELALAINPNLQTVLNNIAKARQSLSDQSKQLTH